MREAGLYIFDNLLSSCVELVEYRSITYANQTRFSILDSH